MVAGQLIPVVGREAPWQYFPHVVEMLTVVGAVGLSLFLYMLGNRYLPLEESESAPQGVPAPEAKPARLTVPASTAGAPSATSGMN